MSTRTRSGRISKKPVRYEPEEIVEDKPHLTLAGIYSALAYYYDNKESLDTEFANYERESVRLATEYSTGNQQ